MEFLLFLWKVSNGRNHDGTAKNRERRGVNQWSDPIHFERIKKNATDSENAYYKAEKSYKKGLENFTKFVFFNF